MFRLLGVQRSDSRVKLAGTISDFYADDERMIEAIVRLLDTAEHALHEVDEALGERPGEQRAYNVPRAAQMLSLYAAAFKEQERNLRELVDSLRDAESELGKIPVR